MASCFYFKARKARGWRRRSRRRDRNCYSATSVDESLAPRAYRFISKVPLFSFNFFYQKWTHSSIHTACQAKEDAQAKLNNPKGTKKKAAAGGASAGAQAAAPGVADQKKLQVAREALDAVMTGRMTEDEYNALAWQTQQSNLLPCDVCGRTFNAKALQRHQNACKPGGLFDKGHANAGPLPSKPKPKAEEEETPAFELVPEPRPKMKTSNMVLCPYCGREYGSQSLPIHIKVCQTKHHDVKISPDIVEKVLSGNMNKEEVKPFLPHDYTMLISDD